VTETGEYQSLAERGTALLADIDRLVGNITLYNLGKMVVDDDTYDTLNYLERESKKTRLSYHTIHAPVHKRWADWANDVERTMLQMKGTKSELSRFRKLRDQVNGLYSRQKTDLPSISQKVKEQLAMVERLPSIVETKQLRQAKSPTMSRPRSVRTRVERLVERVEKNPYYKLSLILGGVLGLLAALLGLFGFL
jgi:hypothetical protein